MNTPGFRADYETMKQTHVKKGGMETRVYASLGNSFTDFKQGSILRTGRDLDVAIQGHGFFSVQSKTGQKVTRVPVISKFLVMVFLTTATGEMVLGRNWGYPGCKCEKIRVGDDGTISIKPIGGDEIITVGKMKLVNPDIKHLQKAKIGLFLR